MPGGVLNAMLPLANGFMAALGPLLPPQKGASDLDVCQKELVGEEELRRSSGLASS